MGIKFLCPNGHKLHVKSFLSGKKAICPKCGVRVVVPAENQPAAAEQDQEHSASEGSSDDILGAEAEHAFPPMIPSKPVSAAASDPIAEAPTAVWYVRPATGGQFGPASGEIMRAWLREGRVGASSLVWHAAWPDWRPAASTFPQLGPLLPSPGILAPAQPVLPVGASAGTIGPHGPLPPVGANLPLGQVAVDSPLDGVLGPSMAGPPLVPSTRRRRKGNDAYLIASVILVVVSILLAVILFLVWPRQNAPPESEIEPTPPAREVSLRRPCGEFSLPIS